jgi:hypothetical protein
MDRYDSRFELSQAFANRPLRQIRDAVDPELAHYAAPVCFDGAGGDEQALADLRRREALGQELQNFSLALGEHGRVHSAPGSVEGGVHHPLRDLRAEVVLPLPGGL